jgi:hypothetical protein
VEHDPAHQLDVEHPLIGLSETGLADRRERLEQQLLERLAVLQPLPELDRLRAKLVVGELAELWLERRDVGRLLGEALHAAPFAEAKDLLEGAELLSHRT